MFRNLVLLTVGVLGLMLVLAYVTTDTSQREEPSAEVVADLFDTVAFSGFGEKGPTGQGPYLRRWTQPVRIALVGEPKAGEDGVGERRTWEEGVEAMAELYDQLPNLDIAVVDAVPFALEGEEAERIGALRGEANLMIWTVPEDGLQAFAERVELPPEAASEVGSYRDGCAVVGATSPVLSMVSIVLRAELSAGKRNTCLGESLAMALGFNIEAKNSSNVFRERQGMLSFHPLGRMATALVYDPALRPGMPRAEALDAAMAVLKAKGLN